MYGLRWSVSRLGGFSDKLNLINVTSPNRTFFQWNEYMLIFFPGEENISTEWLSFLYFILLVFFLSLFVTSKSINNNFFNGNMHINILRLNIHFWTKLTRQQSWEFITYKTMQHHLLIEPSSYVGHRTLQTLLNGIRHFKIFFFRQTFQKIDKADILFLICT